MSCVEDLHRGSTQQEWWNFKNEHYRIWQVRRKSVFGFLLQNKWEHEYTREMSTLLEFRHRILMPLIDRGLDVNLHINDFYISDPSTKSTYPNVFAELIRNALSNFNTSSQCHWPQSSSSKPAPKQSDRPVDGVRSGSSSKLSTN